MGYGLDAQAGPGPRCEGAAPLKKMQEARNEMWAARRRGLLPQGILPSIGDEMSGGFSEARGRA